MFIHIVSAADEQRNALMQCFRFHFHNAHRARTGFSSSLFHNHSKRIALVHEAQLPLWFVFFPRIKINAAA